MYKRDSHPHTRNAPYIIHIHPTTTKQFIVILLSKTFSWSSKVLNSFRRFIVETANSTFLFIFTSRLFAYMYIIMLGLYFSICCKTNPIGTQTCSLAHINKYTHQTLDNFSEGFSLVHTHTKRFGRFCFLFKHPPSPYIISASSHQKFKLFLVLHPFCNKCCVYTDGVSTAMACTRHYTPPICPIHHL